MRRFATKFDSCIEASLIVRKIKGVAQSSFAPFENEQVINVETAGGDCRHPAFVCREVGDDIA